MKLRNLSNSTRSRIEIVFHILVWGIIFVFPHMLMVHESDAENNHRVLTLLGAPITLAFVFYVNYLWLVPRYLLSSNHKSMKKFIAYNLLAYIVAMVVLNIWTNFVRYDHKVSEPRRVELNSHPKRRISAPEDSPFHHQENAHDIQFDRREASGWQRFAFEVRDFLLFILITILAILIQRSNKFKKAEDARQEAELKRAESEVKSLINQLSPHFLLNTLNNIYALIAISPERAQESVDNLSKMLRHMLYENRKDFTTLGKDIEFIEKYIKLMELRLSDKVDIKYEFDIETVKNSRVVPLILIPLVENAFKHGVSNTEPSFIHINIKAQLGLLHCLIENSNHPKTASDRSGNGIGLDLIKKRLDLI